MVSGHSSSCSPFPQPTNTTTIVISTSSWKRKFGVRSCHTLPINVSHTHTHTPSPPKNRRKQTLSESIYKLGENSWQQNNLSALSSGSKQSCLKVPSCQYQIWEKYPWHGRDLLWEQEYWKSWIVSIFQDTDKSKLPRQHWQMNYTEKNHF